MRAHLPLTETQRVPRQCSGIFLVQQFLAPQLPAANHVVAKHQLAMGTYPSQLILA